MVSVKISKSGSGFGYIPHPDPLPDPTSLPYLAPESDIIPDFPDRIEKYERFPGEAYSTIMPAINLKQGCYRISFTPNSPSLSTYSGTMRVDKTDNTTTISGDLYSFPLFILEAFPFSAKSIATAYPPILEILPRFCKKLEIPVYPRNNYYSYLQVTSFRIFKFPEFSRKLFRFGFQLAYPRLELIIDEWVYNKPAAGSFNGSFNNTATRTIEIKLYPKNPPNGYSGSYFEGSLYENGVNKGTFKMGWVSTFFRKATLEIDTLVGSVAPQPVPSATGVGNEDFRTIYEDVGWDLKVLYNDTDLPVPAGLDPTTRWTRAEYQDFMANNISSTTDLDKEWRLYLFVMPASMGFGRGWMFDRINVHREGVVTFSDDGYQGTEYDTANGQTQRNVPRAYLRSAAHETGHGFAQIHQSSEAGGSDNSIMTTTPDVADELQAAGQTFPDDIQLGFNDHVKHHLIHSPDPVVRPGAMDAYTGHDIFAPESDDPRYFFSERELELKINIENKKRLKLGEPLPIELELVNNSNETKIVPDNISLEYQFTHIQIVDPDGNSKPMPPFLIYDSGSLKKIKPSEKLTTEMVIFWGSRGFAFEKPGKHNVQVRILWVHDCILFGVKSNIEIWVDYPTSDDDNVMASLLLNEEVGMTLCLNSFSTRLKHGKACVEKALDKYSNHEACKCLKIIVENFEQSKKCN